MICFFGSIPGRIVFLSQLIFVLFSSCVCAYGQQSPADDFARRQAAEQQQEKIEMLRAITPRTSEGSLTPEQAPLIRNGSCFTIDRVEIESAVKISQKGIAKITTPYEGKCIGLGDIQEILRSLTNAYLEKGYITARVYVPEQDIQASRKLRLFVQEGRIKTIYMNGMPVSDYNGVIGSAFPGLKGRVANMRDIEQGLDQMNRLSSNNGKSEMLPGGDDGHSILNISNTASKRWHASIGHDNLGQDQTGFARETFDLSLDNMLQINDQWTFNYQRTDRDYWRDSNIDGHSNSYSGSVSVPYGYWLMTVSGYYYDYKSVTQGNFGPINTSGDSSELRGALSRVLWRDGQSITTFNTGLAYKETNNFLKGSKIEVGSRRYSVGNIGISHSRQMLKGTWTFDLTYSQGIGIFGAVREGSPSSGDADPHFSKVVGTVSAVTPFKVGGQNFELNNLVVGQYAGQNLFGAEQISLGSTSNVRGTRDSLLFGNNGIFTRNDLVWRVMPWQSNERVVRVLGELRPYVGIDYGRIFAQARYGIEEGDLAGWTVGAKFVGGLLSMEVGYSDIFSSSVSHDKSGQAFASIKVSF